MGGRPRLEDPPLNPRLDCECMAEVIGFDQLQVKPVTGVLEVCNQAL